MPGLRYACVHLYALPLEQAFGLKGERGLPYGNTKGDPKKMRARATAVRGGRRALLVAVSDVAQRGKVHVGMGQVEARARLPRLLIRDQDPMAEQKLLQAAAEVAFMFGPNVEVAPPQFLLVEIGKSSFALQQLGLSSEREVVEHMIELFAGFGHQVSVAIADDLDTARTFASFQSSLRSQSKQRSFVIVPPKESAKALAKLPIESLLWTDPLEDEKGVLRERLRTANASFRVLGVKDVGHLASFPIEQVITRFGDAGALLMNRALGRIDRPLRPFLPSEAVVEAYNFEGEVQDLEPVLFVLKRLLDRLETRLLARGRAASLLELTFNIGPRRKKQQVQIRLARPTRAASTLLRLCREKISGALAGAVSAVQIEAALPIPEYGAQLDLFSNRAERIEWVEDLVARLSASLGEHAVFSAELADTHRPERAWRARPFEADRAFREEELGPRAEVSGPKESIRSIKARMKVALPPADEGLLVVGEDAGAVHHGVLTRDRSPPETAAAWPKPVRRELEAPPWAILPTRPLDLLREPEPAELTPQGHLLWRGDRLPIRSEGASERLECEWWEPEPLIRSYAVVELEDSRRLWIFRQPNGAMFVHGIFD